MKQEILTEVKPLTLKNKDERNAFLKTYKDWELIAEIEYLRLTVYRRRLKNHTSIIAFEAKSHDERLSTSVRYCVFCEPEFNQSLDWHYRTNSFNLCFNSENEVIAYLTQYKNEIE